MAGYGVTLFFVISGFLITFLLLKEKEQKKDVDIKKFYIRRALRIWPIYYLFLVICIVVFLIMRQEKLILAPQLWWYVFFAANFPFILQNGILIIVHYWSIGVEEQFYLFWPWLVKLANKNLLKIAFTVFILFLFSKLFSYFYFGKESYVYRFFLVTRFHCMMIGAMGAFLYIKKHKLIKTLSNKYIQLISWLFFIGFGFDLFYFPRFLGQEIISIISLSMILGQVMNTNRYLRLENRFFDFIGKISYGIYVIHPLIVYLLSKVFIYVKVAISIRYIMVYLSVISISIIVSWFSYRYYETPFLKLKSKFAIVKSSNSMLLK